MGEIIGPCHLLRFIIFFPPSKNDENVTSRLNVAYPPTKKNVLSQSSSFQPSLQRAYAEKSNTRGNATVTSRLQL